MRTKKPPSHTHIRSYIYIYFQTSENTRKPLFVIIQIKIYYEFYVCTMCKSYDENLHIMCSQSFYIIPYIHWLNFGSLTYANSYIVGIGFFLHEINILRVFAMFQNIIDENIKTNLEEFCWVSIAVYM